MTVVLNYGPNLEKNKRAPSLLCCRALLEKARGARCWKGKKEFTETIFLVPFDGWRHRQQGQVINKEENVRHVRSSYALYVHSIDAGRRV